MINVNLPDGRAISVQADTPEQAAQAAKRFLDNEARATAIESLGREAAQPAQQPQPQGNAVSRSIRGVAEDLADASEGQFFPSPILDAVPRGAALIGSGLAGTTADLIDRPLATIGDMLVGMATAPSRATASAVEANRALVTGDFETAGREGLNALTAGGETALLLAPGAAAPLRSGVARTPAGRAARQLAEADPNLAQAAQQAQRLQASGQPVAVADLTTRQGQGLLQGAARRPGPGQSVAQDFFDPRQADQFPRVAQDIRSAFGVRGDFLDEIDLRQAARETQARPLYREAWARPTKVTDELSGLLDRPPLQRAQQQAQEIAAIEGEALNPIARGASVDTKTLHFMRRALDDQIDAFRDPVTGRLNLNERGRALVGLRRDFNNAIRSANPAFKKADQAWSEGSSAINAMRLGERAARASNERQVRNLLRDGVRDADRDLFELGFAQGLEESIGKSGSQNANVTLRLLSPERQKIMRTALGEERGQAFIDRMMVENLMTRARNRISPNVGSNTAENLQQTANQVLGLVNDVIGGSPRGAAARVARTVGGQRLSRSLMKTQQEIDEALIRMATEDPDELLRLIRQIEADRAQRFVLPDVNAPARGGAASIEAIDPQRQEQRALQGPLQ